MMIEYSVVDICMSQIVSIYILVNFLGRFVMVSMAFPWHFLQIHWLLSKVKWYPPGPARPRAALHHSMQRPGLDFLDVYNSDLDDFLDDYDVDDVYDLFSGGVDQRWAGWLCTSWKSIQQCR